MDSPIAPASVPILLLAPFGLLLAAIALGPLWFAEWWDRHYPKVACGLAAVVLLYYFFGIHQSARVWTTAREYLSFIALIGSLYVVSGGIHITVKGQATPMANVLFLLVGAVAANILGTTGASMVLIRPWLRMNKDRAAPHHVVFFIFIISNVGGSLTPIGDPPLFLGYLMGVPFWWTLRCWPMWGAGVGLLLIMFAVVDYKNHLRTHKVARERTTEHEWRFKGCSNLFFLAVILVATTLNHPLFLREGMMAAAALGSWFTTPSAVHESNQFQWAPVKEVAILFLGIFGAMIPALDWLQANAARLHGPSPSLFYFGCGGLSSVLDNAPTYLCFLKTAIGRFVDPATLPQIHANQGLPVNQIQVSYFLHDTKLSVYLLAISIGSVFFGANTYIGNGPNFMVKAIADHQKVRTPGFLEYVIKYTLPFMVPMLLVVWLLFFRT